MSKTTKRLYEEKLKNTKSAILRLRQYGMTQEDYDLKYAEQLGRCIICGIKASDLRKALVVDHNHETGKVRGLLCSNCNTGLGLFKDSRFNLKRAIKYLRKADGLPDIPFEM